MRLKRICLVLFLVILSYAAQAKRSGGSRSRSRGTSSSSSSSSSLWNRNQKSHTVESKPMKDIPKPAQAIPPPPKPVPKPINPSRAAEPPKASAPVHETAVKKETLNVQQSAPNSGRPIGWNVDGVGSNQRGFEPHNRPQNVNPSHSAPYPQSGVHPNSGYPQTGAYPNSGYPSSGTYPQSGSYPNSGYPYTGGGVYHQPGQYPNTGYPSSGSYPNSAGYQNPGGYPNNNYHGFGQNTYNPQQSPPGHYPGGMSGYGNNPGYYGQQSSGLMGGMFGNNNRHGYGGYGGYGGAAPYAYGYGMKKSGGIFGKHALRNVVGGLAVWYLVSGLMRSPYKVYNYYNVPKEERQEISLPPNMLTLCSENVTNLCPPSTTPICTTNNTFLCVTTMTAVTPCQDDKNELCVNTTVSCNNAPELCQNSTVSADNTTTISLPCFTNMTIDNSSGAPPGNVSLPGAADNKFCVTTMAMPDNSTSDQDTTRIEDGPGIGEKNSTDISNTSNTTSETQNQFSANVPSYLYYGGYAGNYGNYLSYIKPDQKNVNETDTTTPKEESSEAISTSETESSTR